MSQQLRVPRCGRTDLLAECRELLEMNTSPTFENPPLVEFVIGIQFSPLTEFTSAHFGLFWSHLMQLSPGWDVARDAPPIADQFELFTEPLWKNNFQKSFHFDFAASPRRCIIENKTQGRMIQFQPTRFHLNWKKSEDQKPSYTVLISEFIFYLEEFCRFCDGVGIGKVVPNQWEITFINSFPSGEYWNSPEDWDEILPGVFGRQFDSHSLNLQMEKRRVEWSFEIKPAVGRLHVTAQSGTSASDPRPAMLLDLTCRGPIESDSLDSVRERLDIGHDIAVSTFLQITPATLQNRWGPKV